jgi:dCMP deaminase
VGLTSAERVSHFFGTKCKVDPGKREYNSIMERPSFEQIYMNLAKTISQRSTCKRLQVGTVITTTDFRKVLSIGYNGNASGLKNTCDSDDPGLCACVHSESNAIINCDTPRYVSKYVFVTHSPCLMCAKMLINLGNVQRIYYYRTYRDPSSIKMLESVGIDVLHQD